MHQRKLMLIGELVCLCVYPLQLVCIPVGESVFVCVITAYLLQDQTGPVATSHFTLPRCRL